MKLTRKMFSLLLVLVLFLSCASIPAHAATVPEVSPDAAAIPDPTRFFCPMCETHGTIIDTWLEYNYYGNYLWNMLECGNCGYVWSVCFQFNSMTGEEPPATSPITE